ncbi:PTS system mannose/fructose/sorbose family transporter subunit IID [Lacticaseibacillus pabuli]|uniref:PTS system mannose/fructose/sorbose family transporter subunit IID n=1 Tax=Lacticaseibacillus pabuli TaxID=3025672 RepID=A0ABY7WQB0_9LACO|nr:PTS system mannose/fructose/sorbose family transporter subunit IID [Lacticaseibacillus sp. KACC 23028]WDF82383.1 PTS system mannose/fructose/sorbose family transporter subunit IID [Lacticaseibacillus sp. KACC 23028]
MSSEKTPTNVEKTPTPEKKLTKRDLNKVFWRTLQMEFAWNYERQMNLGFSYAMIPALKRLYSDDKKKMSAALKRHLTFFNTTPFIVTFITGITSAMEEQNANDPNFDVSSINTVKASLMGPLAGIGDAFFWGTLRLLATGIGTTLALKGNILGPILFLLVFNLPTLFIRWMCNNWGYKLGTGFLQTIQKNGTMERLTYGAAILGLVVIGAMTASMVVIHIPLTFGSGAEKIKIQEVLNQIVPQLLPLGAFGLIYWLLGKKAKPLVIIAGIAVVSIFASWIGLL